MSLEGHSQLLLVVRFVGSRLLDAMQDVPLNRLPLLGGEGRASRWCGKHPPPPAPSFSRSRFSERFQTGFLSGSSKCYLRADRAYRHFSRLRPLSCSILLSLSLSAWWKHKRVNQLYRLWLCPAGLDNSQMSHERRLQTPSRLAVSLPAGTLMWTPPHPPTLPSPMSQIVWESPSLCSHPCVYFTPLSELNVRYCIFAVKPCS